MFMFVSSLPPPLSFPPYQALLSFTVADSSGQSTEDIAFAVQSVSSSTIPAFANVTTSSFMLSRTAGMAAVATLCFFTQATCRAAGTFHVPMFARCMCVSHVVVLHARTAPGAFLSPTPLSLITPYCYRVCRVWQLPVRVWRIMPRRRQDLRSHRLCPGLSGAQK